MFLNDCNECEMKFGENNRAVVFKFAVKKKTLLICRIYEPVGFTFVENNVYFDKPACRHKCKII